MPERVFHPLPKRERFTGHCGLIPCHLNPCPLPTHWAYVETAITTLDPKSCERSNIVSLHILCGSEQTMTDSEESSSDLVVLQVNRLIDLCRQNIQRQISHELPSLPFETQYVHECTGIMHHYFTDQVHRRIRVYLPQKNPLTHIRSLLEATYTNPIMALVTLSNSQTHKLMLSRAHAADRTTRIVYGIVLQQFMKLINPISLRNLSWLLRLVMALAGLEFYLSAPSALSVHREAMKNLVTMYGGVDALGPLRGYVLNIDRFIATCLARYPLYNDELTKKRYPSEIGKYGKAFTQLTELLDMHVIEFVEDQCRLIDILEVDGVNLMNESQSNSLNSIANDVLLDFLALREKVSADFAHLHAYYHENQVDDSDPLSTARSTSTSRCVLLGVYIVSYPVILGDYYTMMRPMIGFELLCALEQRSRESWEGNENITIWLLFTLATIPQWSGHTKVVMELYRWLSSRYMGLWPQGEWIDEEARRLTDFVWCDLVFAEAYSIICEELLELERKSGSRQLEGM